tara:strand:+ start:189 stop:389 length:201 start_codon:yes stop_codon:yes gene_type:complete
MSNAAVVLLNKKKILAAPKLCSKRLQIEDNIGEGIHIHYRNLRLDFTIRDFYAFADACEKAIEEIE